jgi:NADH-quinone oxidoreductase subunit M
VLSILLFLPLLAAGLLAWPRLLPASAVGPTWLGVSLVEVGLLAAIWAGADRGAGFGTGRFAAEEQRRWIPGLGVSYHVGVDGVSLPLLGLTVVLFAACAGYSWRHSDRTRSYAGLFLFLETACLGVFAALDLVLFFVFFDLSIVGMYFVIAGWGHGQARAAALKFFLYTFLGSLALLLGFIGLYLAARPHTFDMLILGRQHPFAAHSLSGGLVLLAVGLGLAIKTPTVPFHTWLPPAHTQAPAAGSAILAGVLLKMGTYGFLRITLPMLPAASRSYAWVFITVGVVSVLYGALVALAQTDFKRMIAYTSVNHMGYILLAVGVAGLVSHTDGQARALALTGAVTQMVSHGLVTGALFLLSGMLRERGGTYDMAEYSGLAGVAPRFAALTAVAVFASLGLPGLSGFIAEFQIFTGSLGAAPIPTGLAVLGILLTAALLLLALQRMFLGQTRLPQNRPAGAFGDLSTVQSGSITVLLGLSLLIGILPWWLLRVISPATQAAVSLVSR